MAKVCDVNDAETIPWISKDQWSTQWKPSGCNDATGVYTCTDMTPFAVCDKVSYGFAAVPLSGPQACQKCFQLDFDGSNNNVQYGATPDAGSVSLAGKHMIVMASNTGGDVGTGQFDIMIPGGGLGAFKDGCGRQWGVDVNNTALVGEAYGGFRTSCMNSLGYQATLDQMKTCVRDKCNALFGTDDKFAKLLRGCLWYVDWYNTADNPTFTYAEVDCPPELQDLYN